MQSSLALAGLETKLRFRVAALSILRADAATIENWRRQPIVVGVEKVPISLLRHADDQTLLALKAVLDARRQAGWDDKSFADWGVIAAPSFLGRLSIAKTLFHFHQEGAWGVSPHLIPHQSLHGVSGTISQALKIHGPNFGVGGGANSAPDAFLLASALMMEENLPGVWLILTGHETEWVPAADGVDPLAPDCIAVALALTTACSGRAGLHLAIGGFGAGAPGDQLGLLPLLEVGLLADDRALTQAFPVGKWRLSDAYWLEMETTLEDAEVQS